jgi:hypothetical protein
MANNIDFCQLTKNLFATLGDVIEQLPCDGCDGCGVEEESEGVLLAFGDRDITFKTDFTPLRVYVSVISDGIPVCIGDVSTVGVTLLEDGFVLHAHIKTDSAIVKWIIVK